MKKPPFPAVLVRVRADSVSCIACTVTEIFPQTKMAHVDTAGARGVLVKFDELATTKKRAALLAAAYAARIAKRFFAPAAPGIPADKQTLAQASGAN